MLIQHIALLLLGFFLLWQGGHLMVTYASKIAKYYNVPDAIIGLTLVAFGTSAPELIVNIIAILNNQSDLVFGNILGSNISNTLLILGVTGILYPLSVQKKIVQKDIPLSMACLAFLSVLLVFPMTQLPAQSLARWEGIPLLILFGLFLRKCFKEPREELDETPNVGLGRAIALFLAGTTLLPIGAHLTVESATILAANLGISEALIGLAVVALGTSLPELATCVVASLKKQPDMAIGNIIGSNIFNIILILGITSLIRPITFNPIFTLELWVCLLSSAILIPLLVAGAKKNSTYILSRPKAMMLLISYIGYITFIVGRG